MGPSIEKLMLFNQFLWDSCGLLNMNQSEEKAEQEASSRSQLEIQLQEATQESTNLQTELQVPRTRILFLL